jgi:hypothetical protein
MSADVRQYYRHRSAVEREAAASAVNPKAAEIHMRMAELYELIAASGPQDVPDRAPISD